MALCGSPSFRSFAAASGLFCQTISSLSAEHTFLEEAQHAGEEDEEMLTTTTTTSRHRQKASEIITGFILTRRSSANNLHGGCGGRPTTGINNAALCQSVAWLGMKIELRGFGTGSGCKTNLSHSFPCPTKTFYAVTYRPLTCLDCACHRDG